MKKEGGITLIALIITIIVLLILAGVSINLVVGQNGVLGNAQKAVTATKDGIAKEQVSLAWARGQIEYLTPGKAKTKSEIFTGVNLKTTEGTITKVNVNVNAEGDSELIYKVEDVYYKMKVTEAGEVTILEGPTATEPILTESLTPQPVATYLVDIVEVGDYVDIGIDYENVRSIAVSDQVTTTTALTGWRVISKIGNGETGTVKLVSAGCPLTYYHTSGDSSASIQNLEDLNKELTIVDSGTGFRANGLKLNGVVENDLSKVFTTDKFVDTTKGIHALGCSTYESSNSGVLATAYTPLNEIEEVYVAITGTEKSMTELYNMQYALGTTTLTTEAEDNWKSNYTDLLANGQTYWLGGASNTVDKLWIVGYAGNNYGASDYNRGVRPVVSLQSGVLVDSGNTGDGTSSSTAYSIEKGE